MKKLPLAVIILTTVLIVFLAGCSKKDEIKTIDDNYRNYYEIFVRSFYDSNGDGIGDIRGMTEKLDYLKDNSNRSNSLGIDGIWLMPIMPSPTYHKYDVTDYYSIDSQYGTMEDFEDFISACEERGIKVIIDLVLNHSSAQHPWFLSAKQSIGIEPCGEEVCTHKQLCREHNKHINFYNFSREKRAGYHSVGMPSGWYYEGVFWDQMPDLNLDNEEVIKELEAIGKFWIDKGVSGFRLDAVTSFYTGNTSKSVGFLKDFIAKMKEYKEDVYIVGEVWADANTTAQFYESGIDSLFNFPFADSTGRIVTTVRNKNGAAFSKAVEAWQQRIRDINPRAIDAPFLSNHDMGRSGGFLARDLALQKMAASLYLMLPGNSFIYYGEELGMLGSGIDENKRLPFVWSVTDTTGITNAPSNANYTETIEAGVMEQEKDENSLLQFYKRAIRIKNENPEIQRGIVTSIDLDEEVICAYSLEYENSMVYIIHNLSEEAVELNLFGEEYSKLKLRGALTAEGGKISFKRGVLLMPARSTAVLR
jgi:alpha-amylase